MSRSIKSFPDLGRTIGTFLIILAGVAGVGLLQIPQLNSIRQQARNPTLEDIIKANQLEEFRLNLLTKAPTFGFDNLLADWVFLNFLEYFGDEEARQLTDYNLSEDYFEVIVEHDPRFRQIYPFLSASLSTYAAMPEKSVALMEKGLQSMSPQVPPQSYFVWRQKAIDELLFVGDSKAAEESFAKAAEWASTYSDEYSQYIAQLSRSNAQSLENNPRSKTARISAWTTVLQNAFDDRTRQIAVRRIEELGGKIVVTPEGNLQVIPPAED